MSAPSLADLEAEDHESPGDIFARATGRSALADQASVEERRAQEQLRTNLEDPRWRIRNLYWIRDKEGKAVRFTPWPEQEKFLDNLWFRNVVPKARQRGFSTVVQLLFLDTCLFNPNIAAAVIAQSDDIATKIFDDKIKFAWDRLPEWLRAANPPTKFTQQEIKWKNGSSFWVSVSPRGTTLQRLHVSELGQIASKNPARAKEIKEGALPTVDKHGIAVVESTVESPNDDFSKMCQQAQKVEDSGKKLSVLEYKLHFASWWDADEYEEDPELVVISPDQHEYFNKLEVELSIEISPRKRAWYVAKLENDFGGAEESMWRQYPSTLKEAMQVSNEGMYYGKQLVTMRKQGRIGSFPYDPRYPVYTYWDIGVADDIAIVFLQKIAGWNRFIDFFECSSEPYDYVVREGLNSKPYVYGCHFLPHDANQRRPGTTSLKTPKDMLEGLKIGRIEIIERILELQHGIDQTRLALATAQIDDMRRALQRGRCDAHPSSCSRRQSTSLCCLRMTWAMSAPS